MPSFADRLAARLEVEGLGTITVDTAFGGDSFVIAEARSLGFAIAPDEARELALTGMKITAAANAQCPFRHPEADWNHISFCFLTGPVEEAGDSLSSRNACVVRPGKIDRSPTGTGCSAFMAVLHAKGLLEEGRRYVGRSIIETRFDCRIVGQTRVAGRPAIIPEISGRAWITGTQQLMLDPDDPFPEGYRIADTWPVMR